MGHGFARRLEPLTIVTYDVDVDDIFDFTTDQGRREADVELADMACAWELDRAYGREPASWRIASRLRESAPGILVPSYQRPRRHAQSRAVEMGSGLALSRLGARSKRATAEKSALVDLKSNGHRKMRG